jgi:two-component system, chemotaxis family, chemotaxis protein CheY
MNIEMKILIVDDFAMVRKIIRHHLKMFGYENIEEAEDGAAALDILKAKTIDFIIADWNMPNMTGIELLRAIRADAALGKIPFLMITAEVSKDNVLKAIQAGVDGYIAKPFEAAVLNEKIDQIMAKQSL